MRHLPAISIHARQIDLSVMGVIVGVAIFLSQPIGIDETTTFQLQFL